MITVDLQFRLPGANEYIAACRRNRYAGGKLKAEYTQAVALYFRGLPPVTKPVKIRFIWHERTRRRDKDNVAFGKKFILDGMLSAGFLPSDNNRLVVGFDDGGAYYVLYEVIVEVLVYE